MKGVHGKGCPACGACEKGQVLCWGGRRNANGKANSRLRLLSVAPFLGLRTLSETLGRQFLSQPAHSMGVSLRGGGVLRPRPTAFHSCGKMGR